MDLKFPERISLAQLPTPIEHLSRLSGLLEGPEIYVKRDDYTGLELTGNKSRKVEFLLAEAISQGCDTLITCGGHQSNHARTVAVVAAKYGLKSHLILRNGVSASTDGNLFVDRLVSAEIQYVTPETYQKNMAVMQEAADLYKSKGRKPYIIPEGGSNETGALGYVLAAQEIAGQIRETKTKFHHIVLAVGSGGTHAGLLLGKYLYDLPAKIHGINVCDDREYFVKAIHELLEKMRKRFQLDVSISRDEINIIDGYVGKGYGLSSQEEIDAIKLVARTEGLLLDPVYTGKAMFGLCDLIKKGEFKKGENVLFIHTGGIFGLFPKKSLFF